MTKQDEYTSKLLGVLQEIFDKNSESDFHIDMNDFVDGDNLTDFFHALANVVPCHLYNKFTSSSINILDFNYVANRLVVQNINK